MMIEYIERISDMLYSVNARDAKEYVDMNRIVRCMDCKHWQNRHICKVFSKYGTIETTAYDYCSRGEVNDE